MGKGRQTIPKTSLLVAAVVLVVTALSGCEPSAPPDLARPDILLLTIDTLRVDRLGSYGYYRDTTPFLDSLASEGVRFVEAYSVSSWTVPSMASLLTGLHPRSHGVLHGLVRKGKIFGQEVLSSEHRLLAELLKEAGYRTYGVSANLHLATEFGFGQGLDRYESLGFTTADKVLPVLQSWREEIAQGSQPYFLWVHLFDPHDPYYPREPWISEYSPETAPSPDLDMLGPSKLRRYRRNRTRERVAEAVSFAEAAYDSEINYTDRAIREIFDTLAVSPRHLVVVTSDHGEEFLDHRNFGHATTLYDEQIRIPLILRLPGNAHAGTIIEHRVSLLDILPSVLDYLEIEPPAGIHGTSFLGLLQGDSMDPDRPVFVDLARPHRELSGVVAGRWKYIHDFKERARHLLFDMRADPGEQTNLVASERRTAARLAGLLSEFHASARSQKLSTPVEEITAETVEKMRALGYVD